MDRSRYVVPETLGGARLERVLAELVPEATRSRLQKLVRRGGVQRNGGTLHRSNVPVQTGELLDLDFACVTPPADPLCVVHEDDGLLVFDKPAGLIVHANERSLGPTLAELAQARFGPLPLLRGPHRPGVVHRLDRETSGLIAVARTERAMAELLADFAQRRVQKGYLAIVQGVPPEARFAIDLPLQSVPGQLDRQCVAPPGQGRESRTSFTVLESWGDFALLACRPETGRRHQIRVHLCEAGTPIVGDRLYGSRLTAAPPGCPWPARHALHAHTLELRHPTRGESLSLMAPLPPDLERMLAWLRRRAGGTRSTAEPGSCA